jgi:hypothetical protein
LTVFVGHILEFTARAIQKTWKNSHVVYLGGKPMIQHLLRCQGLGVAYYGLTLGRLGFAVPSAFATLGSSEEARVLFEEYL